jgi:DNA-binding LacI/PurR family transcriptional regulator
VDGMVVYSSRLEADEVLGFCGRVPAVLVNREAAGADCIIADATQGLHETLDYLTALGHRRIAYVQGSARSWSNAHRVEVIRALGEQYDVDLELAVPLARAGTLSMELLARAAAGERATPRTQRLDTHLVVRASTGPVGARPLMDVRGSA